MPVSDLTPLTGLLLKSLELMDTKVTSLQALHGMPLTSLDLERAPVSDLSPLRGMVLTYLKIPGTRVTDLSPLRGMPLAEIDVSHTKIATLAGLEGAPLVTLAATNRPKELDISALRGAPLTVATFYYGAGVKDWSPLAECRQLERLGIDGHLRGLEALRGHPSLKTINRGYKDEPVAEFWAEYDAQQGGGEEVILGTLPCRQS